MSNIETLYKKLRNKTEIKRLIADECKKNYNTVQNHWLSAGFSIPEEYQARVTELLQNAVHQQNLKDGSNHGKD